jgi:hypothetical protein
MLQTITYWLFGRRAISHAIAAARYQAARMAGRWCARVDGSRSGANPIMLSTTRTLLVQPFAVPYLSTRETLAA